MSESTEKSRGALAAAETILTGVRSALLAEQDAVKQPLRQSTEFTLVGLQADFESAAALLRELDSEQGARQPFFEERISAGMKNAEFLLERLSGVLVTLSIEEPLFRSYERIGENLAALSRAAAGLREGGGGPEATGKITAMLGIR